MKKLKKKTSRKKYIKKKNKNMGKQKQNKLEKNNLKKLFTIEAPPQHQDTQLGSKNLPQ